jgi:hypothetical protein
MDYKQNVIDNLYSPDDNNSRIKWGRTQTDDNTFNNTVSEPHIYKSLIEYNCNLSSREGIINVIVERQLKNNLTPKYNPEIYYPKNSFKYNTIFLFFNQIKTWAEE